MRISKVSIALFLFLSLFTARVLDAAPQTFVGCHGQLKVVGNRIVDANGEQITLRGMSLYAWASQGLQYYNPTAIARLVNEWKCTVLRIPILPGSVSSQESLVRTAVDACIANGIYAIIDWHSEGGAVAADCATFMQRMATTYGNTPNVMYEPWNEPVTESWATVKAYHEQVIAAIRPLDPDKIIFCGNPQWDQTPQEAAADPITTTKNIAYVVHFYAASHGQWLIDDAAAALNEGAAVFATEYGTCEASGSGTFDPAETQVWWDFLNANGVGHTNWSVSALGETSAVFNPGTSATAWTDADLKPSGVLVKNYIVQMNSPLFGTCGASSPVPTSTLTFTPTPIIASTWRVNAGGPAYTDTTGNLWSADTNFTGGTAANQGTTIAGTTNPTLYDTQRYGGSFSYVFNVPAGTYQATLQFAETYPGDFAAGDRVFNVLVNGTTVLTNLDVFAQVGANTALNEVFNNIAPSGGAITLQFVGTASKDGNAMVEAIQVIPQPLILTVTPTNSATFSPTKTMTSTATATTTFTFTATNTNTPVPPTVTATNTPLPPTSTPTSPLLTPTSTSTSVPPTPTATSALGKNGLGRAPEMGWNNYNHFGQGCSDSLCRAQADAMVSSGMAAAGYQYINIDDSWMGSSRVNGHLVANATKFPNGIAAVAAYVHSKGLKLGIYEDHGTATCQGYPGSYGYETVDANDFASWGVDFLKEDNCNLPGGDNAQQDYQKMANALVATGRPIYFNLCAWAFQSWMPSVGNSWRTTGDISDNWTSIMNNVDTNENSASAAGPGGWNDPDMLEVGNGGMSSTEDQSEFTMWCEMASPLIAGNDLTNMSTATLNILTNGEAIAVDQDPVGNQGVKVADNGSGLQVYSKILQGTNTRAVVLLNRSGSTAVITANWSAIGIPSGSASVRDLWAHADLGSFTNSYSATVVSHGSAMLKIVSGGTPIPTPTFTSTPTPIVASTWRVNAGGAAYTDTTGNLWSADTNFTGGTAANQGTTINGTVNPTLYDTQRYGGSFTYVFNVPAGNYQTSLLFAETYPGDFAAGDRVFNVLVNGVTVLANLDVYAQAGANTALNEVLNNLAPSGGAITLQFVGTASKDGNAVVEAIQIVPQPPTPTPTNSITSTPTRTLTFTPTATNTFTSTVTNTAVPPTVTATNTPVPPTVTSTNTAIPPSATASQTPTNTYTFTGTATPTNSPVPPSPTPTSTFTPVPPTFTSTATDTSVPPTMTNTPAPPTATNTVVLPTATGTNTPLPPSPTATPTPTWTRTVTPTFTSTWTVTPVPPTPTFTAVPPPGSFTVDLISSVTSDSTNSPHPWIEVVNTGNVPLNLNNVEARYWFNSDSSNQTVQSWVDWAGLMPAGTSVTSDVQVTVLPTTLGGQTNYVSYKFTGNLVLQPGQMIQIQSRFNLSNWANMLQDNDWSFAAYTSYTPATHVTGYLGGTLVWGQEPSSSSSALKAASVTAYPNPSTGTGVDLAVNLSGNTTGSTGVGVSAKAYTGSSTFVDPSALITLKVYTIAGRLIWSRTLTGASFGSSGNHDIYWNEKDFAGGNLASGLYIVSCAVKSLGQTNTVLSKLLILK